MKWPSFPTSPENQSISQQSLLLILVKESERDITGIRSISHQQHAQRAQIDVLLVFVGHQSPVHVPGLHTRHLGYSQDRDTERSSVYPEWWAGGGCAALVSDLCTGTLSGSMTEGWPSSASRGRWSRASCSSHSAKDTHEVLYLKAVTVAANIKTGTTTTTNWDDDNNNGGAGTVSAWLDCFATQRLWPLERAHRQDAVPKPDVLLEVQHVHNGLRYKQTEGKRV